MGIVAEMSNGDTPSDSESEEGYETPPEGTCMMEIVFYY